MWNLCESPKPTEPKKHGQKPKKAQREFCAEGERGRRSSTSSSSSAATPTATATSTVAAATNSALRALSSISFLLFLQPNSARMEDDYLSGCIGIGAKSAARASWKSNKGKRSDCSLSSFLGSLFHSKCGPKKCNSKGSLFGRPLFGVDNAAYA